mmetsp:Transcript_24286/g.66798  ORF Transcript_24286/g.66798 Transcript_24286/m.66798 type:complete len:221 (+) Transcript_24286:51-713(+)
MHAAVCYWCKETFLRFRTPPAEADRTTSRTQQALRKTRCLLPLVVCLQRPSWLHVVLALLLIELALLLRCRVLVLLILRDQVVHVALGLRELHLVHALARVPVEEGLAPEHRSEVLGHALEHLLDRGGVSGKCHGHLEALGRDVAHRCLDVVGDPFHKVRGVLVLDVQHLLIHLFCGHAAAEKGGGREVPAVPRVSRAHHVLGIEHLLCELGHGQGPVLL